MSKKKEKKEEVEVFVSVEKKRKKWLSEKGRAIARRKEKNLFPLSPRSLPTHLRDAPGPVVPQTAPFLSCASPRANRAVAPRSRGGRFGRRKKQKKNKKAIERR